MSHINYDPRAHERQTIRTWRNLAQDAKRERALVTCLMALGAIGMVCLVAAAIVATNPFTGV